MWGCDLQSDLEKKARVTRFWNWPIWFPMTLLESKTLVLYRPNFFRCDIEGSHQANSLIFVPSVKPLDMSLMYIKKKSGPSTVPWGTPERTDVGGDSIPSTKTLWFLPIKKDLVQSKGGPLIPLCSNFRRSPSWSRLPCRMRMLCYSATVQKKGISLSAFF